jgi:hypothetical protein
MKMKTISRYYENESSYLVNNVHVCMYSPFNQYNDVMHS